MRIFIFILVTAVALPVFAKGQDVFEAIFRGIASSGGKDGSPALRISGGFTNGSIKDDDFDETKVQGANRAEGSYGEVDLGGALSLHFGVSKTFDTQSQFNYNNGGLKASEIEQTRYQYGLKINIPGKVVNPYLGGGYITGPFKMKDTATEAQYEQTLHGLYWHVGLDIMFGAHMGIRLGFQEDEYIEEKFHDLDEEKLDFTIRSGRAGLLFYF